MSVRISIKFANL